MYQYASQVYSRATHARSTQTTIAEHARVTYPNDQIEKGIELHWYPN